MIEPVTLLHVRIEAAQKSDDPMSGEMTVSRTYYYEGITPEEAVAFIHGGQA